MIAFPALLPEYKISKKKRRCRGDHADLPFAESPKKREKWRTNLIASLSGTLVDAGTVPPYQRCLPRKVSRFDGVKPSSKVVSIPFCRWCECGKLVQKSCTKKNTECKIEQWQGEVICRVGDESVRQGKP